MQKNAAEQSAAIDSSETAYSAPGAGYIVTMTLLIGPRGDINSFCFPAGTLFLSKIIVSSPNQSVELLGCDAMTGMGRFHFDARVYARLSSACVNLLHSFHLR
jgi:hypothetical protein